MKSALAFRQPLLGDDLLAAQIQAWGEPLAPIPTEQLNDYYVLAIQEQCKGFIVNPSHIMAAWNDPRHKERRRNEGTMRRQMTDQEWADYKATGRY